MMKVLSIFLMSYYSIGLVFFPMADFSYMKDMSAMHEHCSHEEHDLTFHDFISEHLFCFGATLEIIEGDFEDEGELPHQSSFSHTPDIVFTLLPVNISASFNIQYNSNCKSYIVTNNSIVFKGYLSEVFRPPLV